MLDSLTLDASDVMMGTRLDRLARSTRDLLNTVAAITGREGRFPLARRHLGCWDAGYWRSILDEVE
jgi:DNA invertase Pin-like site-specific DNA recombinase